MTSKSIYLLNCAREITRRREGRGKDRERTPFISNSRFHKLLLSCRNTRRARGRLRNQSYTRSLFNHAIFIKAVLFPGRLRELSQPIKRVNRAEFVSRRIETPRVNERRRRSCDDAARRAPGRVRSIAEQSRALLDVPCFMDATRTRSTPLSGWTL